MSRSESNPELAAAKARWFTMNDWSFVLQAAKSKAARGRDAGLYCKFRSG